MEDLCRELYKEGIRIRKQSLQNRFNAAAARFLKEMVEHALAKKLKLSQAPIQSVFNRIIISDSTLFELPEAYHTKYKGFGGGASEAGIKNQFCYDLLSHEIIDITVQSATIADRNYPLKDLHEKDLRIEDLGYFKLDRLKAIEQAGAYYLSRMRFGIGVFIKKNGALQRLDMNKIIRKMKVGEIKSIRVICSEKERYSTRMILEKVPKKIADEKRRKLKTDKQINRKDTSKDRLSFCDLNVFVTNCSKEQLPDKLIRQCYSLRWQVEIIFKAWKSYFKIANVRQMKIERFECLHYGCLMLIILSTQVMSYFKQWCYEKHREEISELKFLKLISSMHKEMRMMVQMTRTKMNEFLDKMAVLIEDTCFKEQKNIRLKPLSILKKLR